MIYYFYQYFYCIRVKLPFSKGILKGQPLSQTSSFSSLRVCCCGLGLYCLRSRFSFYHFPVSAFVMTDSLYSAFLFEFCYLLFYSFLRNSNNFRQFIYRNIWLCFYNRLNFLPSFHPNFHPSFHRHFLRHL
jgi:hypothetical protein